MEKGKQGGRTMRKENMGKKSEGGEHGERRTLRKDKIEKRRRRQEIVGERRTRGRRTWKRIIFIK